MKSVAGSGKKRGESELSGAQMFQRRAHALGITQHYNCLVSGAEKGDITTSGFVLCDHKATTKTPPPVK